MKRAFDFMSTCLAGASILLLAAVFFVSGPRDVHAISPGGCRSYGCSACYYNRVGNCISGKGGVINGSCDPGNPGSPCVGCTCASTTVGCVCQ